MIARLKLWDKRQPHVEAGHVLLASPRGFRWLRSAADFDNVLGNPQIDIASDADNQAQ
jgi:hypothetical protein